MDLAASASIPILPILYREYITPNYYQFTDSRLTLGIQALRKLRSLVDYSVRPRQASLALRILLKHLRVVGFSAHLQQIRWEGCSAHKQWVINRKLVADYLALHQSMLNRRSKEVDFSGKQSNSKAEAYLVLPPLSSHNPSKVGVFCSDLLLVNRNRSRVGPYSALWDKARARPSSKHNQAVAFSEELITPPGPRCRE